MTKRPDDDGAEFEDGLTTSERRRRRRRAGIRIPSDNVPRRSGSGPVVAPVPEDPALAVSIAYAFGDEHTGRAPTTLPPDELAADLDDATAIADVPIDGSVPSIIDDVVPDGRTRQMPAINLEALGLSALDPDAPMEEVPDVTAEQPVVEVPDDGELEVAGGRATSESEAIDIVVDEPSPGDGVPKMTMPRAPTVALSEDDLEELLEATSTGMPPSRPRPSTAPPTPPERTRSTMPPVPPPAAAPSAPEAAPASSPPTAVAPPIVAPPPVPAPAPVAVAVEAAAPTPSAPADPTDSSEILADEILEVDDRAPAVEAAPMAPMPATPSGPISTSPPPPPAATKPPPAPGRRPLTPVAASPDDKRKRRGKPWFEDLFDEDYLRTLPFLTPQATQFEAGVVVDALGLTPGASVLDLGCGYGRHAMELAARGLSVVGVDQSLPMLLRGADEAQRRGLDINFVHADMRELDFDGQFDGAYCLFSTFGYFDDETNKKVASLVAKALKPGAKFMLEVLNRDYVIGDLPTRVWWEGDGCVVLEEVEFNYFSSRVQSKRSVVFDDGRQIEQEISLRVYSLHEMGKLLHAAGLRVLEVSGSMVTKGRFLGNRSREILVIAERRADAKPTSG